eukprot:Sro811_g205950.2  (428) ;mRNA; r:34073-35356
MSTQVEVRTEHHQDQGSTPSRELVPPQFMRMSTLTLSLRSGLMSNSDDSSSDDSSTEHESVPEDENILDLESQLRLLDATSLPVAAEIADDEETIRERVVHELFDDCSVATVVEENKPFSHWSSVLYTIVAVIVIVCVIVATSMLGQSFGNVDDGTHFVVNDTTSPQDAAQQEAGFSTILDHFVLARVPETICYERAPLMGSSTLCSPPSSSQDPMLGSAVTDLVAASRLWSVPEADISILHAGEVDTDIAKGNFTLGMAKLLLPHHNNSTLVTMELQGYQIAIVLERALQKLVDDWELPQLPSLSSYKFRGDSYPYGAGIRFHVNMSQPFPRRLDHIQVKSPRKTGDQWEPLEYQGVSYTVATSSYLARGMDGYQELGEQNDVQHHTGLNSLDEFVAYCQHKGTLVMPDPEDFSTQLYIHDPKLVY